MTCEIPIAVVILAVVIGAIIVFLALRRHFKVVKF